jgi:hypothetical protein
MMSSVSVLFQEAFERKGTCAGAVPPRALDSMAMIATYALVNLYLENFHIPRHQEHNSHLLFRDSVC